MTDDFELRIEGLVLTRDSLRQAVTSQARAIIRAIEALQSRQRLYSLTVELSSSRSDRQLSLPDACETLLASLLGLGGEKESRPGWVSFLAEVNALSVPPSGQPTLQLRLNELVGSSNFPAGTGLVDDSRTFLGNRDEIESWARSIGAALSSNVMARADAEFAVMIDLPTSMPEDRVTALLRGLELARSVATVLPAAAGAPANLVEQTIRLRDDQAADGSQARLRIWRLGFMKVPSRTRLA